MTYRKALFSLLTLLAICATAFMTLLWQNNPSLRMNESSLPDAYMENVTAIILNKSGKISMKIVTPKMVHYAEKDTTHFIAPQLTLYHKSPTPWYIEAKTANARHGIDHIVFQDEVNIHHPAEFNNPATVIKTNSLTVHPNENTAETADLITMIQPNSVMKAVGMFADMETGNIKLLSQAKGEYVPDA
jgi:lipopolysaccharide export system protein LptC